MDQTKEIRGSSCVAQLVEQSLPIPEVRRSNPVISKNLFKNWTFFYCQPCIEKTKIKKKTPGMSHFIKKEIMNNLHSEHPGSGRKSKSETSSNGHHYDRAQILKSKNSPTLETYSCAQSSSLRTRADHAAKNGRLFTEKTVFIIQMANSMAYYAT